MTWLEKLETVVRGRMSTPDNARAWFDLNSRITDEVLELVKAAKHTRETLLPALLHGDKEHQDWLRREIDLRYKPFDAALANLAKKVGEGVTHSDTCIVNDNPIGCDCGLDPLRFPIAKLAKKVGEG